MDYGQPPSIIAKFPKQPPLRTSAGLRRPLDRQNPGKEPSPDASSNGLDVDRGDLDLESFRTVLQAAVHDCVVWNAPGAPGGVPQVLGGPQGSCLVHGQHLGTEADAQSSLDLRVGCLRRLMCTRAQVRSALTCSVLACDARGAGAALGRRRRCTGPLRRPSQSFNGAQAMPEPQQRTSHARVGSASASRVSFTSLRADKIRRLQPPAGGRAVRVASRRPDIRSLETSSARGRSRLNVGGSRPLLWRGSRSGPDPIRRIDSGLPESPSLSTSKPRSARLARRAVVSVGGAVHAKIAAPC